MEEEKEIRFSVIITAYKIKKYIEECNKIYNKMGRLVYDCKRNNAVANMENIDKDLWKFGDNGVTRRFSWREAAVIQTFPRTLEFTGDLISKYKQIGNAVPVKLAEAVAKEVYKTLQECKIEDEEYIQQSLIID